jgi:hypothetical protein
MSDGASDERTADLLRTVGVKGCHELMLALVGAD